MKKTNLFYAAGLMMVCAFGVQSCSVDDNGISKDNDATLKPAPINYNYDFAKIAKLGENPKNQNGSANNGQAFYCWERDDKSDSKRQDYKGYKWTEGSLLPQVCHVWRRSDRIEGNIKQGGLYCPSDKEMAIDGLQAGSKVQIIYEAPEFTEKVSLKELAYGEWSAWVGGELTTPSNPAWNEGTSSDLPYGDGSVIRYADLSQYAKLIVDVTEGTPRFLFNRDIDEGQWSENEAESHLIDNTKEGWSAKYFSSEKIDDTTTRWTVDLALMVADKGFAHLHAIKGITYGAKCTATSMQLESYPAKKSIIWAVGDGGTSGIARATATIAGSEAIIGVTPILSGDEIEVTSTIPEEKGTGYIVFKVFKGMVIKQIVIKNAVN